MNFSDEDIESLTSRTYYGLIESTAEAQKQLLETTQLVAMFGDKALSPSKLLRGSRGALARAPETNKRMIDGLKERIENNYRLIAIFEAAFEQKEKEDINAMADFLRSRRRKEKSDGNKATS